MCGGKMVKMPCSRVGHVYRIDVPYAYQKANTVSTNFRRVAEVWIDEYKFWLYDRRPSLKQVKELKCKSFKWYLESVAHDTVSLDYASSRSYSQVGN